MLTTDPHDMGDHDAPHEAHECDCSVHNAQELYLLVSALAAEKGIDLDDPHDLGDDDHHAMDLRLIADLAIAHGAEPDELDDDLDDDGDESGDEFDVSRFSDDDEDDDTDDDDSDDTDDFDIIDLDGVGDDEDDDEAFSDGHERMSADLVTTPPFNF